ncbi:hypothetical protein [Spirosoma agri]|uniref:Uncharacterized protein n=1 Tax=Spirosoma agri TaxID=1987381 RepID=A0A6M0IIB1_9BACT|nr:hypothetical protein [Spirosoma agri]NEU67924.1 hypothetical protein [Spirosoma agri]
MSHPFTIIKGGQSDPKPPPKKFATFDNRRVLIDRIMAKHMADRDKAVRKLKAKHGIK